MLLPMTNTTTKGETKRAAYESYFDEEGKQLRPFPAKWMSEPRIGVGERVEYLRDNQWHGRIGTVVEVNKGYGPFPSQWHDDGEDDGGFWRTEHAAWIVVDFGPECVFGHSWKEDKKVPDTRRAFHVCDEGDAFRRVK